MSSGEKEAICPICDAGLGDTALLAHLRDRTYQISTGEGARGYTFQCLKCGAQANMYWNHPMKAGAGLGVHVIERHGIQLF